MKTTHRRKRRKQEKVVAPQEKRPPRSLAYVRSLGCLATSALAIWKCEWTQIDELVTSSVVLAIWMIVLWFFARRAKRPRVEQIGMYRFHNLIIGTVNGVVVSGVLYVWFGFQSTENDLGVFKTKIAPVDAESTQVSAPELVTNSATEYAKNLAEVQPVNNGPTEQVALNRPRRSEAPSPLEGEVVGVETDESQSRTTIQLHVERDGKFVSGLGASDFSVSCGGKVIREFSLTERKTGNAQPLQFLLLIDVSESTAKFRMNVEDTVVTLIEAAPKHALFRPLVFSTRSKFVSGWTNDRGLVRRNLSEVQSGGRSSLRPSLIRAVRELRSRSRGKRFLIVFTDGHNNFGGSEIAASDLVALCREAKVRVIAIGIEHESHKPQVLRQLAEGTNGRYFRLGEGDLIVQSLANVSSETGPASYFITPNQPISGFTRIQIGNGTGAVELSTNVPRWSYLNR